MKTFKITSMLGYIEPAPVFLITVLLLICQSCSSDLGELDRIETSIYSEYKHGISEQEQLEKKIRPFYNFKVAQARGYNVQATGYRCGMGFHFLNPDLLDNDFEIDKPEVLLYVPDEDGIMQLVGVEYATPISDLSNPPPAPEGFMGDKDVWEISTEFSLWTLHAWPVIENSCGYFNPRNPVLEGSDDCNICD